MMGVRRQRSGDVEATSWRHHRRTWVGHSDIRFEQLGDVIDTTFAGIAIGFSFNNMPDREHHPWYSPGSAFSAMLSLEPSTVLPTSNLGCNPTASTLSWLKELGTDLGGSRTRYRRCQLAVRQERRTDLTVSLLWV
jgi:hypothetical protein